MPEITWANGANLTVFGLSADVDLQGLQNLKVLKLLRPFIDIQRCHNGELPDEDWLSSEGDKERSGSEAMEAVQRGSSEDSQDLSRVHHFFGESMHCMRGFHKLQVMHLEFEDIDLQVQMLDWIFAIRLLGLSSNGTWVTCMSYARFNPAKSVAFISFEMYINNICNQHATSRPGKTCKLFEIVWSDGVNHFSCS